MESLAAFPDEELDSFNTMFSTEELDLTQQLLNQFSFPMEHDEGLSFLNPSTFCPNPEANMGITGVNDSLLYSSNALGDKITDSFPAAFPDITLEGSIVNVIEDMGTDDLGKFDASHPAANVVLSNELLLKRRFDVLELHAEGEKINSNSSENTKKRPRVSKDAPKVDKNVQYSKKNRKINLNGSEGNSNIGSDGQSSSTTCSSEDDNVSQDANGVATSDSKASQALNLNGKTRAIRGSATDPQSLYARKRRERINERLRILQNLVPNGTKVDISTMLEEAVHYVKFLQLQIKLLSSDDLWMYAPIAYNGIDIGLNKKISTLL